ncbi:uncharacterized protein VDAG_09109 [Verticillium dahliae VdLs.17]|uniref:Uncharacterized protein n=1 Tax=Verticillium dahliae (strain VdLs.17 / ATCC MYA-4575 / FGSC 10137) TaxID=498257 RepID=G2XFI5_VERDV|nr:uncharacterized protein VDAG_09109 [Verticillium dahliae VdLs.17]EGY18583.1 hypothetical protein VDAG_09109 [Verticillium dahliae VdLs.17]
MGCPSCCKCGSMIVISNSCPSCGHHECTTCL